MDRLSTLWTHLSAYGKEFQSLDNPVGSLKGKTVLVSGASRGIGKALALRCAEDGANVAILAKTDLPHPKLPGTIYSAAEEIREKTGAKVLALKVDIRDEEEVRLAIEKTVAHFGGLDIVINNASSLNMVQTEECTMKRWDLMNQVNCRGTFVVSKFSIPHLKKSANPHILILCPPPNMQPHWFGNHLPYSMAKYGMTMTCLGLSHELQPYNIAVNGLWPLTTVATAAVNNVLGGTGMMMKSRTPRVMADAMHYVLTQNSKTCNGNFFVDEDVLRSKGVTDFSKYLNDPRCKESDLVPDFFLEPVRKGN